VGPASSAERVSQLAEESLAVAERLNCRRLLVFGTELGPDGGPLRPIHEVTGAMWLNAHRTLCRLAELGERAGVTFCLENLNTTVDHPGAPSAIAVALKEMSYCGTVGLEAYASGEDEVALERFSSVFGAGGTTAVGWKED
jgi:hydroxypyruvate isomerase